MSNRIIRDTTTIRGGDLTAYLSLKAKGYTTLWSGEGRICMEAPCPHPTPYLRSHSGAYSCADCGELMGY